MRKTLHGLMIFAVLLGLALSGCGARQATPAVDAPPLPASAVVAEGKIKPVLATNLSFQARGVVKEIKVSMGDQAKKGDVLVRLDNADTAEAQLVAAQQAYDLLLRDESGNRARLWQAYLDAQKARGTAENKWEDLNVDNIEDRIDDAEEEVEDRQADLEDAQEDFDKYKDLGEEDDKRKEAEDDLETAQENLNESIRRLESIERERDTVRAAYDAALSVEAEAKHQYELSLDGPNTDQLALAKAQLEAARDALEAYVITAPFDGVVADVAVTVGDQIGPETRAVSLADFSSWVVETTDITELEVVKITEGQPVTFVADALPDVTLNGVITEISRSSILQSGDVLYTVRIRVYEVDPRIRWGMTVEVTFESNEK
jgi:multidrug efflux pump subunit AcrA (membrane-fusion protein)